MESFQLVSAGRITHAVGTPCLRNRVTLVRGTTFVHVNSLSQPPWITFYSLIPQSHSPSLRSLGRKARLWDNPLLEARNPG
jgi:hypothetical protein